MEIKDFEDIFFESHDNENLDEFFAKTYIMAENINDNLSLIEATDLLYEIIKSGNLSTEVKELTTKYLNDFAKMMRKKENENK
jgi:hypothetical protein